jgi:serine/threonine protein phosphatase 1
MSLTYAIGDIHGCHSELVRLLGVIEAHAGRSPYSIVCVGDYVDKGPDSAGVLDLLINWKARSRVPLICLKGNHDDVMAKAADDPSAEAQWMTMSGQAVLAQYGIRNAADLPRTVVEWLRDLPLSHDDGQRYFVHAGVDPARPLDQQTPEIQMTMRGVFLTEDIDFGRHIVHGHTPQLNGVPELKPFRTNLDTNVALTGHLTAALFDDQAGGPVAILATTSSSEIKIRELRQALVAS